MTTFEEGANYLLNVAAVTLIQLFVLGGPGLLLLIVLNWLAGRVQQLAIATFGVTMYLVLFGWLGTIIHEIGHLLSALLFRQKIVSYRLFAPNLKTGELGNVRPDPNYGSLYQVVGMIFIGIAPVVFGTLVIYFTLYALFHAQMPEMWRAINRRNEISGTGIGSILTSGLAFLGFVFSPRHLLDWRLYLFLYIAFSVGSSISLSDADIRFAKAGCLPMIAILFMLNIVLLALGNASGLTFAWLTQYYTFFYILLCFVILLEVLVIAILWLPAMVRSASHR